MTQLGDFLSENLKARSERIARSSCYLALTLQVQYAVYLSVELLGVERKVLAKIAA